MPQFDLMNLVLTWASHHLGLIWIDWLWFRQGAHLILVTVVLFYASRGPSVSVPHLRLHGLVTLVLTQASLGPGYSIPHLGLTLTRDLWSNSGPQTKLVTLVPFWASPLPGDSGHPLGFTWAW